MPGRGGTSRTDIFRAARCMGQLGDARSRAVPVLGRMDPAQAPRADLGTSMALVASTLLSWMALAAPAGARAAIAAQDPLAQSGPEPEAAVETRTFSLPDTRLVRALFESARGH